MLILSKASCECRSSATSASWHNCAHSDVAADWVLMTQLQIWSHTPTNEVLSCFLIEIKYQKNFCRNSDMRKLNSYSLRKHWYQPCFLRRVCNYKPLSHMISSNQHVYEILFPSPFYDRHWEVLFCLLVPDYQMQVGTAFPWTLMWKGQSHSVVFFCHKRKKEQRLYIGSLQVGLVHP